MYVDVILPLPLAGTFTYQVPHDTDSSPKPGMRVVVPLGKKKLHTGIVYLLHSVKPTTTYEIKEILCFLDEKPIVNHTQLKLWEWLAEYYMCSLGEVYKVALPNALKLESETKISINPDFESTTSLSPTLQTLLDKISDEKVYGISELSKEMDVKNLMPTVNKLLSVDAISITESLGQKYKPKMESHVVLHPNIRNKEQLQSIFEALSRASKQLNLLMHYLEITDYLKTNIPTEIKKTFLLEKSGATSAVLKSLIDREILQLNKVPVDRLKSYVKTQEANELNEFQSQAYSEIYKSWKQNAVTLLHGVTSSGKTEVYIKLIQDKIEEGKQVLFLVPEIALTTQLTDRLKHVFGEELGIYHSKFSNAERVEIYQNLLDNKSYRVVLGTRSAVFLPFRQLGLVIVDEEHDTSYKQQDPAPRYNGRNAAIVLAGMHHAKTLLGTATPAVETYHNAESGKFGLVRLAQRYKNILLPEITIIDTQEAYRKKCMTGHFSDDLVEQIRSALERKEQIIVFQNRRGYAPYVECKACNAVPRCMNCDVSLTFHKKQNTLVCHYCGHTERYQQKCAACGQQTVTDRGFGTEKIEDEINTIFPEARVARMDLDTTRTKNSYQHIINDFQEREVDILVGTQMVTKGLNFENVSLVAVLNADNLLNQPDFRAYERAFQMLEQVSGRAGRMHKQGTVIIQTSTPNNEVVQRVVAHDYVGLYKGQLAERQLFRYPPYYRLLQINIKHRDAYKVDTIAQLLVDCLSQTFGKRCSKVIVPMVSRTHNLYIRQILLRIESHLSVVKAKSLLSETIRIVESTPANKGCLISVNVDPSN